MAFLPLELSQQIACHLELKDIKNFLLSGLLKTDEYFWKTLVMKRYSTQKYSKSWLCTYLRADKINGYYFYLTAEYYSLQLDPNVVFYKLHKNISILIDSNIFALEITTPTYRTLNKGKVKFFFLVKKLRDKVTYSDFHDFSNSIHYGKMVHPLHIMIKNMEHIVNRGNVMEDFIGEFRKILVSPYLLK